MRRIAIVVAAAAACGGGGKDPAVCRREAEALGTLLTTMDYEAPAFYAGDIELALRSDTPRQATERGETMEVRSDGVSYRGRSLDAESTTEYLVHDFVSGKDGPLLYVAIDKKATWENVGRAVRAAYDVGYRRVGLAFQRPPAPVTRPSRSPIDDDLDRLQASDDGANKATEYARMVERIVKGCAPMVATFSSVAADDGESKAEKIVRAIEPSLVKCNCNVDLPAFRSVMFRLLHIEKPQSAFVVTLDPAAAAVVLPPETLWREAHVKLTPGARVWIPAP